MSTQTDQIVIEGIEAYDGSYDFDASYFTNRELHTIKRLTGIRAGELGQALAAGDSDMLVALAAIALQRHNKHVDEDLLWDGQMGTITYQAAPDEDDALPPAQKSGDDASSDAAEKNESSGPSSTTDSENPASSPSPTGPVASAATSDSDPAT